MIIIYARAPRSWRQFGNEIIWENDEIVLDSNLADRSQWAIAIAKVQ